MRLISRTFDLYLERRTFYIVRKMPSRIHDLYCVVSVTCHLVLTTYNLERKT